MKNVNFLIAYSFMFIAISTQICGSEKKEIKQDTQYHELGMRLISAVKNKNLQQINDALNAGANINYQTQDTGETAFHIACIDYPDIVVSLILAGINTEIKDKNGRTGIDEIS